jgi:hypothetical protein
MIVGAALFMASLLAGAGVVSVLMGALLGGVR